MSAAAASLAGCSGELSRLPPSQGALLPNALLDRHRRPGLTWTQPPLDAYLDTASLLPGDTMKVHIRCSDAQYSNVSIHVFRLTSDVWNLTSRVPHGFALMGPMRVTVKALVGQSDAELAVNGCPDWTTVRLEIPSVWPGNGSAASSDLYFLQISSDDYKTAFTHVPFILRTASPNPARLAVVLPEYTYQAYNVWGGASIYSPFPTDPLAPTALQRHVSFHRPYLRPHISYGDMLDHGTNRFSDEAYSLRWFCSGALGVGKWKIDWYLSSDLETNPELLSHYNCFVSYWHDEYWTSQTWKAYHGAIYSAGVNAIFLGGNTGMWKANVSNASGQLAVWKSWGPQYSSTLGLPWPPRDFTTTVTSDIYDRTGYWWNGLMPVNSKYSPGRWIGPSPMCGGGRRATPPTVPPNYTVNAQDHWAYAKTGMRNGQSFPTIVVPEGVGTIVGSESDAVNFIVGAGGIAIPTSSPSHVTDGAGDYSSHLTILAYCDNLTTNSEWTSSYVGTAAKSPAQSPLSQAQATVSILEPANGPGHVFAVGSNDWPGLGFDPNYASTFAKSVGQITANVFNKFLASKGTGSSAEQDLRVIQCVVRSTYFNAHA